MSDINLLISNASYVKLIEERGEEILRLRERLAEADDANRSVSDANEKLREKIKVLVEALRPFAIESIIPPMPDETDDPRKCSMKFLKAAAAALKETGE